MKLSDHDLLQLTEKELEELPEAVVRKLSVKLLLDLKEARERLRQTSKTSSRPPSSDLPWNRKHDEDQSNDDRLAKNGSLDEKSDADSDPEANATDETRRSPKTRKQDDAPTDTPATPGKRKPGKQPGAQGFGRQQSIKITAEQCHYPERCAICEADLAAQAAKVYTAFETLDIIWGQADHPGIQLTNTRHTYFEKTCERCGHATQEVPHRESSHPLTPNIQLCEWRLIGQNLAALIVCLAYRMRLSRPRIQEFFHDWFALHLCVGLINATLHESGAAALPIEEELVEALQNSSLLYVDETTWPEATNLLWLWVFCSETIVAYWIASRGAELIDNVLGKAYTGILMSDGWYVYRTFLNRLRCWAHLIRKAKGLATSLDVDARQFGQQTLELLGMLMEAVYQARQQLPDQPLPQRFERELRAYHELCHAMTDVKHDKTRKLAREMLNDWDAIFHVLTQPEWPLTNNEAERMLRHWVILRRISYGTRTENGTRLFAILISVIETCRIRQQSPWLYLAEVIRLRRSGFPVPKLPLAKGV